MNLRGFHLVHVRAAHPWVTTCVLFAAFTVALCGLLLGLHTCRGKAEDRPRIPAILTPAR